MKVTVTVKRRQTEGWHRKGKLQKKRKNMVEKVLKSRTGERFGDKIFPDL